MLHDRAIGGVDYGGFVQGVGVRVRGGYIREGHVLLLELQCKLKELPHLLLVHHEELVLLIERNGELFTNAKILSTV